LAYDDRLRIEAEFIVPKVVDMGDTDGNYVGSVGGSEGVWIRHGVNIVFAGLGGKAASHCVEFGYGWGMGRRGSGVGWYGE